MKHNYYTLTRQPFEEIVFHIVDSNGKTHEISQIISNIQGNQVRISLKTPENVSLVNNEIDISEPVPIRSESVS